MNKKYSVWYKSTITSNSCQPYIWRYLTQSDDLETASRFAMSYGKHYDCVITKNGQMPIAPDFSGDK